jgi:uncharacterized membrane-anchored protein
MAFDQMMPGETYAAKELRRWNTPRSQGGMRPDRHEEFPAMVYKARRPDSGGPILSNDPRNESWSAQNQLIVKNERELEKALSDGWRRDPQEAIAHANALEDAISTAAAHRAYEDRNMSERAKAEAKVADEATADHMPEIPEKPKRKYTRRKPAPAAE